MAFSIDNLEEALGLLAFPRANPREALAFLTFSPGTMGVESRSARLSLLGLCRSASCRVMKPEATGSLSEVFESLVGICFVSDVDGFCVELGMDSRDAGLLAGIFLTSGSLKFVSNRQD